MAAMTQGRRIVSRDGRTVSHPVKAAASIFTGALVVLDSGWLAPGRAATTLKAVGVAENDADNTDGANGDVSVNVRRHGAFRFRNSASGDLIGRSHIGGNAYIVDDQTVAATDGSSSRSVAGKIIDVDAEGVWIEFI